MNSRFSYSFRTKIVKKEHQEKKILKPSSPDRSAGSRRMKQKKAYSVRYAEAVQLVREAVVKTMPSKEFLETESRKLKIQTELAIEEKQAAKDKLDIKVLDIKVLDSREQTLKGGTPLWIFSLPSRPQQSTKPMYSSSKSRRSRSTPRRKA